jgi:valyl-tRNA synthetase
MADAIYHFVWDQFCDWYLELIKPAFVDGERQEMDAESKIVAGWVLDQILVMLHPFMPFITEELWHSMGERKYDLIHAMWPEPKAAVDVGAKSEIEWLIALTTSIRSGRAELNIPPHVVAPIRLAGGSKGLALERIVNNRSILHRLARVEYGGFGPLERTNDFAKPHWDELAAQYAEEVQSGSLYITIQDFEGFIPLEGLIDLDAERTRITKAIEAACRERDALAGRLSNAAFVEKAKPEAVEKARADHAEKAAEAERLAAALARLG